MEDMIKKFIKLKRNEVSHLSKRGIEGKNGLLLVCRNADTRFKHLLIDDMTEEEIVSKKTKSPKTSKPKKTTKSKKSK